MPFDTSDVEEEEGAEEEDGDGGMNLDQLRELLKVLKEFGVGAFDGGGITVRFEERSDEERALERLTAQQLEDENRSTSPKPVAGFASGFSSPQLWKATNGKRLNFYGTYED